MSMNGEEFRKRRDDGGDGDDAVDGKSARENVTKIIAFHCTVARTRMCCMRMCAILPNVFILRQTARLRQIVCSIGGGEGVYY